MITAKKLIFFQGRVNIRFTDWALELQELVDL